LAKATLTLIDEAVEIARAIHPCRVRAIHYQLFILKLIPSMGDAEAKKVSRLTTLAREMGLLPWEWITDNTRAEEGVATWDDPEAYARTVQFAYRRDKWQAQPKYIIIWSEKGTVEGTIRPVLRKYELPLQTLHGWSGATPIWDMAQANLDRHQKTLILYIGDYDPSGLYMSEVDLPQRLYRYSSGDPSNKDVNPARARRELAKLGLEIRRVALLKADTRALGRSLAFPASDKGPKEDSQGDSRYDWFVRNYGHWCWELDALDPNILRRRLEDAILAELDREAWDRYVAVERLEKEAIITTCRSWTSILGPVQK
jgi:hypothetical protein